MFAASPMVAVILNEKELNSLTYCKLKVREEGGEERQGMCFLYLWEG